MQTYFLLFQILHENAIHYILRGTVPLAGGRENAKVLCFRKSIKLSVSGSVCVLCKSCLKLEGTGGDKCIRAQRAAVFLSVNYVLIVRLCKLTTLKGQCHEIFCFRFFHGHLPPSP